jgi:hypothetical protein
LVAANAGKAALRTIAAESASALLNIFISRNAIALSYERLPMVFIPGRRGAAANIAKLPALLRR